MALSFIAGIESGLNLPLDFGIYTRRNGSGRYPRRCSDVIALSLDCGVDQSTRSTPEVRLPLFSVTRFTARAFPLNEQVSSRCKVFTFPTAHLGCLDDTRLQPSYLPFASFPVDLAPMFHGC